MSDTAQDNTNFHDLLGRIKVGEKNIAVIDTVGTIGIGIIYANYFQKDYIKSVAGWFLIGHLSHIWFKQNTQFTKN